MLNDIELDDWQKQVLEAKGDILLCTGRQVGKTEILAIKAARRMLEKKTRVIIASLTEDQAELIIQRISEYITNHNKSMLKKGRSSQTKHIVRLINGSEAQSRAVGNTGASLRGFTAEVFIGDEASRLPADLWAAALPTLLMTGGECWLASTPFGRVGYFWECYENKDGHWKIFAISSEEVIKNRKFSRRWTPEIKEKALKDIEYRKQTMPAVLFQQEYCGLFVENLMQWFPDELIKKCQSKQRPVAIDNERQYFLGCDIGGRGGDDTALEIIDRTNRKQLVQVENITKQGYMTTMVEREIIHLDSQYRFKRIYIDSAGMGVGVFDHLLETNQIKRKVVSIENARRSLDKDDKQKKKLFKEDLYNNLLCLMERGEIFLLDDPEIFQSLKSVQFEIKEDKSIKIFGTYTHIAEGLIRAAWCAKDKSLKCFIA